MNKEKYLVVRYGHLWFIEVHKKELKDYPEYETIPRGFRTKEEAERIVNILKDKPEQLTLF